ncbi:MAG: hypothetical protein ACOY31_07420, partial [Bacillota bacterium]
ISIVTGDFTSYPQINFNTPGNYAMWITFAILEELPTFGVAPGSFTGRGSDLTPAACRMRVT